MTRWQPLPATLPGEARQLVEQLRVLKGRTGLSLADLARRTAYSKSSWQRYLSGDRLPPRSAAQVLCRLGGGDQTRLLALWELAEQAWPQGASEPPEEPVPIPEPLPAAEPLPVPEPRTRRWRTAALAAFGVIVLLTAGLLWALPRGVLSRACRSTRSCRSRCP
ncbi:helix-turn-helix transcriptional regulator [Streptomyces sp. NPDC002763]|jgi:transcriptional regulator with XRE-family HTH domain|uniref:helix-turn-helix domain-containing protein n=1 Tax=Streptomyces sp. NPDC002763 TaxID=3154427 RepID=UPI0033189B13